jgi:hypothetical protein
VSLGVYTNMNAGVIGRRTCATLAACSAVLHGVALGNVTNVVAMVVLVGMLIGCLYCARDLWRSGTVRGWLMVALMNFAMIAIHLPASGTHHHGTGGPAVSPVHESMVMDAATVLAVVEVTIAAVVLYYRTRAMRPLDAGVEAHRLTA